MSRSRSIANAMALPALSLGRSSGSHSQGGGCSTAVPQAWPPGLRPSSPGRHAAVASEVAAPTPQPVGTLLVHPEALKRHPCSAPPRCHLLVPTGAGQRAVPVLVPHLR